MKLLKKTLLLVLLLLVIFVANIFISTGYFRTIVNKFDGDIVKRIEIPGAEDITISLSDSFAIISSTKRGVYPPTEVEIGGLYFMDLKSDAYNPIYLTSSFTKPFAPHGITTKIFSESLQRT